MLIMNTYNCYCKFLIFAIDDINQKCMLFIKKWCFIKVLDDYHYFYKNYKQRKLVLRTNAKEITEVNEEILKLCSYKP